MPQERPQLTVDITDLAFGGDGVGHTPDGRAIFVPFTIPGEQVEVEIARESARFCRGELRRILRPSPERVTPPCPHFGRCGGCQYQHIAYPAQVTLKSRQLRPVLERLGNLRNLPAVEPVVASPQPYGYRNKLTLEPGAQNAAYGFFALDNMTVIPIENCPLAMPGLNRLLAAAKASPEARRNLALRSPQPLVLRQPAVGDPVFFAKASAEGRTEVTEQVTGRAVTLRADGFWQVNPDVAAELVATLEAWFTPAATPVLVDAYAGAGAFSLALGALCRETIVIEANAAALAAAERNRREWGLGGATFLRATTETALPGLLRQLDARRRETTVILDPPRTGCLPVVTEALAQFPVANLFYVSCNAATLARDLRTLCASGEYALKRLAWFDMFPQTAHFETLAWLGACRP